MLIVPAGGKLLLAGNGGSAADAKNIAGELVGQLNYDRAPASAIALTTDPSVLTAIANDYGYEGVFERQIAGLGRAGDVLIAISTSGRSHSPANRFKFRLLFSALPWDPRVITPAILRIG
jgi:D-sedoheptulose 7-phosphate isomerase